MINKVKIGIKDYSVEIDNALSGRGSNGSIDLNSRSIKILPNEIKDEMSIVLFHELWHGVFSDAGRCGDDDYGMDEELVDFLALKTLQLFRDNPDLIEYLK